MANSSKIGSSRFQGAADGAEALEVVGLDLGEGVLGQLAARLPVRIDLRLSGTGGRLKLGLKPHAFAHDLENDPSEIDNLGSPANPRYNDPGIRAERERLQNKLLEAETRIVIKNQNVDQQPAPLGD